MIIVKHQPEHEGQKVPKHNVGESISSYGIEWCPFSQNPCIDVTVFSNQT